MARNNHYSKYKNQKVVVDGIKFDSKKEAVHYLKLRDAERNGHIKDLKMQVRFELQPNFKKNGRSYRKVEYIADFTYTRCSDNQLIVEDVKGYKTDSYRLKKKWFEYTYMDLELVEI